MAEQFTAFTTIVRGLSEDKFSEVLTASTRQARETYFSRHRVEAPKKSKQGFAKPGAKNEARAKALHAVLSQADDDEMCEEILRTWLLTKRPMLAAALDHLKIPHNDGLTESTDLDKVTELSGRALKELVAAVSQRAPKEDIAIYLKYLGCKDVDAAVG